MYGFFQKKCMDCTVFFENCTDFFFENCTDCTDFFRKLYGFFFSKIVRIFSKKFYKNYIWVKLTFQKALEDSSLDSCLAILAWFLQNMFLWCPANHNGCAVWWELNPDFSGTMVDHFIYLYLFFQRELGTSKSQTSVSCPILVLYLRFVFLFYPANQVTLLTVMHIVSYDFFFFLPGKPRNFTNSNSYHFLRVFLLFQPSEVINCNATISYGSFFFFTLQTK